MKSLAFGEILWDQFDSYRHIGGAAFNFAAHLARLGAESRLVSCLGSDDSGTEALKIMDSYGVGREYMKISDRFPTGTVSVLLEDGQPTYTIHENSAWDNIALGSADLAVLSENPWDILYFGTLAQRSSLNRITLQKIMESIQTEHIFFDVNIRQNYYSREILMDSLNWATIVKLNEEEAGKIGGLLELQFSDEESLGARLAEMFNLNVLIITRGKEGARIFSSGKTALVASEPVELADAVGAGDSFSAAFMYAYVKGCDAFDAGRYGALLGSFVASSRGAVPEYSDTIRALFRGL